MPKAKDRTLNFQPVAEWSLSLERAEQIDADDNVHDLHRVVVSLPDGTEEVYSGPNADEALHEAAIRGLRLP